MNKHPNSLRPWLIELYAKHFSDCKVECKYRDETDLTNGMKTEDAPEQEHLVFAALRDPNADIYQQNSWNIMFEIGLTYDAHGVPVTMQYRQTGMEESLELCRAVIEFRTVVGQALGVISDLFTFDHTFDQHQLFDLIQRGILLSLPSTARTHTSD